MNCDPYFEWRGLGFIASRRSNSPPPTPTSTPSCALRVAGVRVADPKACQCGEVLKGVLKPWQCKVFGTACTPEHPLGALMVSSEGACAAYFNFGRKSLEKAGAHGMSDQREQQILQSARTSVAAGLPPSPRPGST